MSRSIDSNAGTLDRAGFNFYNPESPDGRVYLNQFENPFGSSPVFSAGTDLKPGNLLPCAIIDRSLMLTRFYAAYYWPSVKSLMDWRGGRHAIQ